MSTMNEAIIGTRNERSMSGQENTDLLPLIGGGLTITDDIDSVIEHLKAVDDLLAGYWLESRPEGDVLVYAGGPRFDTVEVHDMGDGPMLQEIVREALADAIARRVRG